MEEDFSAQSEKRTNLTIFSSVYKRDEKVTPTDLYRSDPKIVQNYKAKLLSKNIESSSQSKVITVNINNNEFNSHGMLCPFVEFYLPPIYMKNPTDCVKYCSYPAYNIFSSITQCFINENSETLNSKTLFIANEHLWQENHESWANANCGGVDGPNQQFSYAKDYEPINQDSTTKYRVKDAIRCIVAVPSSIFRNEEIFPESLGRNTPINITFTILPVESVLCCTRGLIFDNLTIQGFKFYSTFNLMNLNVFNNVVQVNPSVLKAGYVLEDKTYYTRTKDSSNFNDMTFEFRNDPTTEYYGMITNNALCTDQIFLGKSNENSRQNWWASLLNIIKEGTNEQDTIKLNEMQFLKPEKNYNYEIKKIPNDEKRFILEFKLGMGRVHKTIISSTIPFTLFNDKMCLNLSTWPTNDIFLRPEHFRSVNFEIKVYDPNDLVYIEDKNISDGTYSNLNRGYCTFIGKDNIKYAIIEINNLMKSNLINSEFFDIAASIPITSINFDSNVFINYKQIKHNIPYATSWDIDGKHKIKVESYKESRGGNTETFSDTIIELERAIHLNKIHKYPFRMFQLHKYFDLTKNNQGSNGFDIFPTTTTITANIVNETLSYHTNDYKITTVIDRMKFELKFTFVQVILRFLRFCPNHPQDNIIRPFTWNEVDFMVDQILLEELAEGGVFNGCFKMIEKKKETDNSEMLNYKKRTLNTKKKLTSADNAEFHDTNSGTNSSIKRFKENYSEISQYKRDKQRGGG